MARGIRYSSEQARDVIWKYSSPQKDLLSWVLDLEVTSVRSLALIRQIRIHMCLRSWHFLVQRQDVGNWTSWRNRVRVDLVVTLCVMILDVRELCSTAERWVVPVAVAHPSALTLESKPRQGRGKSSSLLVKVGIPAADVAEVAFKVLDVHGIKADDGLHYFISAGYRYP